MGKTERDIERPFPFHHLRKRLATDGRLQRVLHIGNAHVQAARAHYIAIDGEFQVRLPRYIENADVGNARNLVQNAAAASLAFFSNSSRSGTDNLDRILPLHARQRFHHVVANGLREIPVDSYDRTIEFARSWH